jgi:hypothetical protein
MSVWKLDEVVGARVIYTFVQSTVGTDSIPWLMDVFDKDGNQNKDFIFIPPRRKEVLHLH